MLLCLPVSLVNRILDWLKKQSYVWKKAIHYMPPIYVCHWMQWCCISEAYSTVSLICSTMVHCVAANIPGCFVSHNREWCHKAFQYPHVDQLRSGHSDTPRWGYFGGWFVLILSLCLPWAPGDASIRCEQLDLLLQWGAEFRQSSSQLSKGKKVLEDLVAFDVVLGDLNFDNCSSGMEAVLSSAVDCI